MLGWYQSCSYTRALPKLLKWAAKPFSSKHGRNGTDRVPPLVMQIVWPIPGHDDELGLFTLIPSGTSVWFSIHNLRVESDQYVGLAEEQGQWVALQFEQFPSTSAKELRLMTGEQINGLLELSGKKRLFSADNVYAGTNQDGDYEPLPVSAKFVVDKLHGMLPEPSTLPVTASFSCQTMPLLSGLNATVLIHKPDDDYEPQFAYVEFEDESILMYGIFMPAMEDLSKKRIP